MHRPSFSQGLGEQETKPFTSLGTIVSRASRHKSMDPEQRCQSIFFENSLVSSQFFFPFFLITTFFIVLWLLVHFSSSVLES